MSQTAESRPGPSDDDDDAQMSNCGIMHISRDDDDDSNDDNNVNADNYDNDEYDDDDAQFLVSSCGVMDISGG